MRARFPIAMVVMGLLTSTCGLAIADAAPVHQLVLRGNGLSFVPLGVIESQAVTAIAQRLGAPTHALSATPALSNCGVTAMATWQALSAYFNDDRLVGLSVGPGGTPSVRTSKGLRLGDSVRVARSLYGPSLRLSRNQGGSWFIATSDGRVDGFLRPSNGRPEPTSRILTIDVGDVGCPAMSP
ncbi:MAG: hypothetical protein WA786_07955 [Acidimicrobiales bacterium]